uniref:glutathione S-transferase N-terminal domain-containing protein n=1 Tax=Acinetobacter baumannii TaxID=470 RepID=UPI00148FEF6C
MPAIELNVIKSSVNIMTVRVSLRAAGLDFDERDVYGQTRSADYLARCPAHLTPMIEAGGLPK